MWEDEGGKERLKEKISYRDAHKKITKYLFEKKQSALLVRHFYFLKICLAAAGEGVLCVYLFNSSGSRRRFDLFNC